MSAARNRRQRLLAFALTGVVAGMVALSFAAVPLYRVFCQVTGYGGTTQRAARAPGAISDRTVTVRFDAEVDPAMPWRFEPVERAVTVRIGEPAVAHYRVRNLSHETVIGSAAYNVTPLKAGIYFTKTQCFCFTEQKLAPGAAADLPVTFFVSPAILADRNADDISTITLSYTFYRNQDAERRDRLAAAKPDATEGAAGVTTLPGASAPGTSTRQPTPNDRPI